VPLNSAPKLLARYRLDASARGYSESTIIHTEQCVTVLITFLGAINDVATVSANDLRRFIVALKNKNSRNSNGRNTQKLSQTTVNTYVRAIRSFW
jgi:site-specific recombinase XerD